MPKWWQIMMWCSQKSLGFIVLQGIDLKNRFRYVLYTLVNTQSNRKLVLELGMGKCLWRHKNPALRRLGILRMIQISFIKIFLLYKGLRFNSPMKDAAYLIIIKNNIELCLVSDNCSPEHLPEPPKQRAVCWWSDLWVFDSVSQWPLT